MKTLKRITSVLVIALVLMTGQTIFAQQNDLTKSKKATESNFFLEASKDYAKKVNTNAKRFEPFYTHYLVYKNSDATVAITIDHTGKKILSIEDSSGHFSEDFLESLILRINSNANNAYGVGSAFGCAWWNIICQAAEALCEGMGQRPDCWDI